MVCALLRLLFSLSPPLQARVHDYVSRPLTSSNPGLHRPPVTHPGLVEEVFLMRFVPQLHTLWRDMRRDLQAHHRSHTLFLHMPCKTTVWSARDGLAMAGPATVSPVPVTHVLLSGCHACQGEYGSCPARIPYLHPLLPSYARADYHPPGGVLAPDTHHLRCHSAPCIHVPSETYDMGLHDDLPHSGPQAVAPHLHDGASALVQGNLLRQVPVYPTFVCRTDSLPP